MFIQIAIGTGLLLASIVIAGVSLWWLEVAFVRARPWLARPPHRPKLIVVLCAVALWIIMQMTIAVWLWALTMRGLGLFETMEASVYFALVAFTTLGFGDVLLPQEWRLLSGMASVNGLLNIGLVTALLVEALRQVRLHQIASAEEDT
ncbi:ion channel [Yoonia sp. BS5-3]|uniref:Ion channel n=1 Tax=Yoonia phaeophyticola TaxID=3137369 RepID=A0ABZ2VB91_9RHOB